MRKTKIMKVISAPIVIFLILLLSGCTEDFLSQIYVGYLDDGTEEEIVSGNNPVLKNYNKFEFSTSDEAEIESKTLTVFDFTFYSEIETDVEIKLIWNYTTTIFNIKHSTTLGIFNFTSTGNSSDGQALSFELEEDKYFTIKNNKKQYLVVEISTSEEQFLCFISRPEILALTNNDQEALEDAFDKELEDESSGETEK